MSCGLRDVHNECQRLITLETQTDPKFHSGTRKQRSDPLGRARVSGARCPDSSPSPLLDSGSVVFDWNWFGIATDGKLRSPVEPEPEPHWKSDRRHRSDSEASGWKIHARTRSYCPELSAVMVALVNGSSPPMVILAAKNPRVSAYASRNMCSEGQREITAGSLKKMAKLVNNNPLDSPSHWLPWPSDPS